MAETIQQQVYIENKLQYAELALIPEIQKKYKEITKDYALTHFDPRQLQMAFAYQRVLDIMVLPAFLPFMINAAESFERDLHSFIQLCRSKFGFQSKLERANLGGDVQGEKGFEKEKAKTIFGNTK